MVMERFLLCMFLAMCAFMSRCRLSLEAKVQSAQAALAPLYVLAKKVQQHELLAQRLTTYLSYGLLSCVPARRELRVVSLAVAVRCRTGQGQEHHLIVLRKREKSDGIGHG